MLVLIHLLSLVCSANCCAGVAIAVMGCIVNGPGEMADADFGYVGGAPGKIDLYVGKEVVQRGIPMEEVRYITCYMTCVILVI
jgi:4-hydroxy-3-methylbut-2-en-1-yl diphosphate synthase IspG/GcpE